MTKIRGGRAILDDLRNVRAIVRDAGRSNIDYATIAKLTEDTGKELLATAHEIDRLIQALEPMLERIEQRAEMRAIEGLEQRIISLEQQVAQLTLEQRGVLTIQNRKQERG